MLLVYVGVSVYVCMCVSVYVLTSKSYLVGVYFNNATQRRICLYSVSLIRGPKSTSWDEVNYR